MADDFKAENVDASAKLIAGTNVECVDVVATGDVGGATATITGAIQGDTVDSTSGDITSADKLVATTNVECVDVDATGDVEGDTGTFASGLTMGGTGVALRGEELDQGVQAGTAFTSTGGGGWETVDTLALALSLDGSIMATADLDCEAAAAAAVAVECRLVIDGNAGQEIGVDLLATQDALPGGCNHLQGGLTAGAINVELQVKDDGVTAVTVNHWSITGIALVQKG